MKLSHRRLSFLLAVVLLAMTALPATAEPWFPGWSDSALVRLRTWIQHTSLFDGAEANVPEAGSTTTSPDRPINEPRGTDPQTSADSPPEGETYPGVDPNG